MHSSCYVILVRCVRFAPKSRATPLSLPPTYSRSFLPSKRGASRRWVSVRCVIGAVSFRGRQRWLLRLVYTRCFAAARATQPRAPESRSLLPPSVQNSACGSGPAPAAWRGRVRPRACWASRCRTLPSSPAPPSPPPTSPSSATCARRAQELATQTPSQP